MSDKKIMNTPENTDGTLLSPPPCSPYFIVTIHLAYRGENAVESAINRHGQMIAERRGWSSFRPVFGPMGAGKHADSWKDFMPEPCRVSFVENRNAVVRSERQRRASPLAEC
jgi:hypothetical protein